MKISRSTSAPCRLLVLSVALLSYTVVPVQAYGGFFGRAAPQNPLGPVQMEGEAIVFGLTDSGDGGGTNVQLQIQMDYNQQSSSNDNNDDNDNNNNFGWILPLPAIPTKVGLGSSLLFHALFQETLPQFVLDIQAPQQQPEDGGSISESTTRQGTTNTNSNRNSSSNNNNAGLAGSTCTSDELTDLNCPFQGPTRGNAEPLVVVGSQGHAGWIQYEILDGNQQAVKNWLESQQFLSGGDNHNQTTLDALLDYYDAQGSVYLALTVAPNVTQRGSIQPLLVEYSVPSSSSSSSSGVVVHKVPTLLSASAPRTLQVYVLSDQPNGRATPVNYLDVTLDDAQVDWVGCLAPEPPVTTAAECYYNDYQNRFRVAVESVSNQSMTTEFSGPSAPVLQNNIAIDGVVLADLEASTTWLEFLQQLEAAQLPPLPSVQAILDQYMPPKQFEFVPPFQCAQWDHVYHPNRTVSPSMDDCFDIFNPSADWIWDPVGLTAELDEFVFQPAREAQSLVDTRFQSLTRLYGQLVAPQHTPEPHFVVTTNKPAVSNWHQATAVAICDIGSPSALEITLQQPPPPQQEELDAESASTTTTTTIFWQPAIVACPTWKKTSPYPVFNAEDAVSRANSMARLFTAWGIEESQGNVHVPPSDNGLFLHDDIDSALQFGNTVLANVTRPTTDGNDNHLLEIPVIPETSNVHVEVPDDTEEEESDEEEEEVVSGVASMMREYTAMTFVVVTAIGCLPTMW